MYILVEQYRYPVEELQAIFGESLGEFNQDWLRTFAGDKITYYLSDDKRYVKFDYVGYCYFTFKDASGCIFFLPKVVMKGDDEVDAKKQEGDTKPTAKILGKYDPVKYINSAKLKNEHYEDYSFILKLSFEVCKAIRVYWDRSKEKVGLPQKQSLSEISAIMNDRPQSIVDLLSALEQFAVENHDWFMFITQQSRNPQKRVNWRSTIHNTQPYFQDDVPVYMNPITFKKEIDFDEELLTIFNSILQYINNEYGLHCPVNEGYDLITGDLFDSYLQGLGHLRLSEIRYRYFSDKALVLWSLCDEFFLHQNSSEKEIKKEYLLAKGFHDVFEKMMDHLLGDDTDEYIVNQKNLKDGKVIDHLYKGRSIVNPESTILYIADSKYYTIGAGIGEESLWKQYTYASDIQNECIKQGWVMDEKTRGYDIIPNYLISAALPEKNYTDFDYNKIKDDPFNHQDNHIEHVDNCIFSSSTKYVFRYHVNFLFIVTLYARDDDSEILRFKDKARKDFRDSIINEYNEAYRFFCIAEKDFPSGNDYGDLLMLRMADGGFLPNVGKVFSYDNGAGREFVVGLSKKDSLGNTDEVTQATIEALTARGFITPKILENSFEEDFFLA